MAFVRKFNVKGRSYFALVKSVRDKESGRVRQVTLKYYGLNPPEDSLHYKGVSEK